MLETGLIILMIVLRATHRFLVVINYMIHIKINFKSII